jgi:hypothetical protein
LKEILKRRSAGIAQKDYIFQSNGKKYYKSLTWAKLKSACNKAGIVYGDEPRNKNGVKPLMVTD